MPKIKAILFDMDGVLIESKVWHYEALNKALALYGYEITWEEHISAYDGLPTSEKLKKLTQEKGIPVQLYKIINEKKQQYTVDIILEKCLPNSKHVAAMSKLNKEGYRIAVCSNSVRLTIELIINCMKLNNYIEFILSNQDVKNAKPDPEIYLTAMNKMGLKPDECLICEDNHNGIKAAIDSGGHLFTVSAVDDVNYNNIKNCIAGIEKGGNKK